MDAAEFLTSSPPRQIPSELSQFSSLRIRDYIGLLAFAGFAMIFVVLFFPLGFEKDLAMRTGPIRVVDGRVENCESTGVSVGKTKIQKTTFSFSVPHQSQPFKGRSYSGERWSVGEEVKVEYLESHPEISRIEGTRQSITGLPAALIVLFPGIPIAIIFLSVRKKVRARRLLREGVRDEALVESFKATNMQVNNVPVMKFQMVPDTLGFPFTHRTWDPEEVEFLIQSYRTGRKVILFADPSNPRRFVLPERLLPH